MEKFEWVEHTADVGFRSFGETLEEAFENAAIALTEIYTNFDRVEQKYSMKVEIKSEDKEALLYDWLDELIYLHDADGFVLGGLEVKKISKDNEVYLLEAVLSGEDYSSEKHGQKTGVKAMTYHMMDIKKEDDKWILQAVVDI